MIVLRLDKQALMHLIETQPEEFKLELSRAVLSEAARAVVRGVIPEKTEAIITLAAEKEIEEQIGKVEGSWNNRHVVLNNTVRHKIEEVVRQQAREISRKAYEDFLSVLYTEVESYKGFVKQVVDKKLEAIQGRVLEDEIYRRLQDALEKITENRPVV